jgi:hypothetical protein
LPGPLGALRGQETGRATKPEKIPPATRGTAFRSNYFPVTASVRNVTDPFLLSASDDAPVPAAPADRIGELARRMHVSRAMLGDMPPDTLDRMEQFAARSEAHHERWGDLSDLIVRKLTAAGFRQHDPSGQRGGFCVHVWDDGVTVAWSATEYAEDMVSPFEKTVEHVMLPALEQLLHATGFTASTIPEGQDNSGDIRVTDWQGPAA